ncbi:hypothetical protein FNU79_15665 [Deinococcus detaillensis]|uniref:Uncharacterized protein n=1 Tax=Deinococcus detaillensis TaxID=2592048 RepID=A0A553ULI6_9DEIO|nr:hypothetical protein FNU79_15665 [Deinococcus detaillensis]
MPSPNQLSAVGVWKGSFYSSRALNNPNPFTLTVTGQDSAGNFTGKVNNAALGPFSLNVTGKINGNQITLNYQTNMAVCDGAFTQENGKTRYQADCLTRDGNGPQSSNFLDMTRQ